MTFCIFSGLKMIFALLDYFFASYLVEVFLLTLKYSATANIWLLYPKILSQKNVGEIKPKILF